MPTETASDKVMDEIVKLCRETKRGDQLSALWRVFNIMVGFIKGQANLINAMDSKIKRQDEFAAKLRKDLDSLREEVEFKRGDRIQ